MRIYEIAPKRITKCLPAIPTGRSFSKASRPPSARIRRRSCCRRCGNCRRGIQMPCCCGSRVAGSGNPKRSRARREASGVLPGIGEVLPGVRAGHTKIRARASKSRGTRRDVAFASGCSETRFPRIAKPRCETASRNGRRGRRRARLRHVRTRRARSQTGARGPRMDGRRVKPIGRRGRTARRISVQGRVRDRRTENPAGNQIGPRDRVAAATVAGNQVGHRVRVAAGDRGWKPSRPQGQSQRRWGSRIETKSTHGTKWRRRPRLETKSTSGSRERWRSLEAR